MANKSALVPAQPAPSLRPGSPKLVTVPLFRNQSVLSLNFMPFVTVPLFPDYFFGVEGVETRSHMRISVLRPPRLAGILTRQGLPDRRLATKSLIGS